MARVAGAGREGGKFLTITMTLHTRPSQDNTPDQSGVSTRVSEFAHTSRPFNLPRGVTKQLASFFNNNLLLATNNSMGKNLRKESYRNFTRDIHISHWKQLHEPQISSWDDFTSQLSEEFNYSKESGWDNSKFAFIPPMEGDDPLGLEYPREELLGQFLNYVSHDLMAVIQPDIPA